ncbi:MAG: hypothetical protein A2X35_00885 [Elusimicrobia bacterium GWA2_61_42]|nr:MAG: hypothetical protein A2X35_00885 [Elusimicrobia bacterium GWA2_61_42]OGR75231.1 MAG: hypothetical protein A2X38_04900 [Elusimicrobia bacterium GWC2_61_25]
MSKLLPIPLLALLCGCGNYFSVRVPYQAPDMPGAAAARPALSALYVVVKTPPEEEAGALGSLAGALLNGTGPDFRPAVLARKAAAALDRPGAKVCAWRVDKTGQAEDGFAPLVKPSGLLVISARRPSVSARKEERSTVYYDKKRQKQTVKNKVWAYSASLSAEIGLYTWPGMELLDSWGDTSAYAEDRFDNAKAPGDWYAENEEKIFSALTPKLVNRYAGRPVLRSRVVFTAKKDPESSEAARLARQNDWDKAAEIWLRRAAASGGWRDYLGLAVAAELKKDYAGAADYYRQAEKRAAGDKDGAKVFWGQIYQDLEFAASTRAAAGCGGGWFGIKTALLPFSDETTSIDGPPLVRQLVYERLKAGGYSLLSLEETDEILRRHGFSDGGQLAAAKPEEIAGWLGAGRLVYGNITDFGEIMAGVYNRRMVKGAARVWDAGTGKELVLEESVVKVKTPKSLAGGLFSQLAKGLAERIKNKPLAYESGLFSLQLTENLPNALK